MLKKLRRQSPPSREERWQNPALARLAAMTPAGMVAKLDVSLTDEYPLAHAIVLIWAESAAAQPRAIP